MVKIKALKRKKTVVEDHITDEEGDVVAVPPARFSDEPAAKKVKWVNRQRVLVFACRGISHRARHLMEDLRTLMPHSKPECKMERGGSLSEVNEMCEMKHCNKCILFEGRRQRDLYMWISNIPNGPCAKFLVENVYTLAELKLTGNCLKGSRPLLSFDENFSVANPHYSLLKEIFIQVFGTPYHHPKSQPFVDHVMTFSVLDNRIWFRNYQILAEDGALAEIGPRFVLNPIKIFDGSFGGNCLWQNPHYVTPASWRQQIKKAAGNKYINKVHSRVLYEQSRPETSYQLNPTDDIFHGDSLTKARELENAPLDSGEEEAEGKGPVAPPAGKKKKKKKKKAKSAGKKKRKKGIVSQSPL